MLRVILICGAKGSGKDAFVKSVHGETDFRIFCPSTLPPPPWRVEKLAFPLRESVAKLLDLSLDTYEETKDLPLPPPLKGTIRDYFIAVAASVRNLDEDFFVKQLYSRIKDYNGVVVVTDWRYPNEYHYLVQMGVSITTIRIKRDGEIIHDHPSESSLLSFPVDYTIKNEY